jgi:hypothetical protein
MMHFYPNIIDYNHDAFPFSFKKVGDEEEKLAEGIKLYAISATATSKRTILSDLITVSCQLIFFFHWLMFCNLQSVLCGLCLVITLTNTIALLVLVTKRFNIS